MRYALKWIGKQLAYYLWYKYACQLLGHKPIEYLDVYEQERAMRWMIRYRVFKLDGRGISPVYCQRCNRNLPFREYIKNIGKGTIEYIVRGRLDRYKVYQRPGELFIVQFNPLPKDNSRLVITEARKVDGFLDD